MPFVFTCLDWQEMIVQALWPVPLQGYRWLKRRNREDKFNGKKNMFDFFAKSRYTLYSQIQHSFWQVVDIDSAPPDWVGTGLQYRLLKCVAQFFWWKECCTMPGDSEHQGEWGSEEDQNLAANWRSIMHWDWSRREQSIRLSYQVSIFSVVSWYWWGFLTGALPRP